MNAKPLAELVAPRNRAERRAWRFRTPRHAFDRVFGGVIARPQRAVLAGMALRRIQR
jgi:hypothetical protein